MRVVEDGPLTPYENMESDYKRLQHDPSPVLRFYRWQKHSATYGYFIKPEKYLLQDSDLALARRPTGGGIIFHDYDLAFSLLIPANHPCYSLNTLDNYAYVNSRIMVAIKKFNPKLPIQPYCCQGENKPNFCMAHATIYDLMVEGKKAVGGAMRKTSKGFLHQGSICLRLPEKEFLKKVLARKDDAEAILQHSFPILESDNRLEHLKICIAESFCTN